MNLSTNRSASSVFLPSSMLQEFPMAAQSLNCRNDTLGPARKYTCVRWVSIVLRTLGMHSVPCSEAFLDTVYENKYLHGDGVCKRNMHDI